MLSRTRCTLSKVEEVEINVEEEDEVLTMDEATKERSALRSGVTLVRTELTTLSIAGTMRRTTNDRKNMRMPAITAEKKDTLGTIVLPGERGMLYGTIGLSKSKEETDSLQTPLATNNDSRGPPPSARR